MRQWRPRLERRGERGSPLTIGAVTITPLTAVLTLRAGNAVFVWNRPVGVDIEQAGAVRRLRIVDQGRLAWLGMGALLLLLMLLIATAAPRKERKA